MNFAVCLAPDPNRMARAKAKVDLFKKDASHQANVLKSKNIHVKAKVREGEIGMGHSRAKSDVYQNTLAAIGTGMQASEMAFQEFAKGQKISDEAGVQRDTKWATNQYKALLAKQSSIESAIDSTMGRNFDAYSLKAERKFKHIESKNKALYATRAIYGAPVFMPPKDKAGQMMANINLALSIASAATGLGGMKTASGDSLSQAIFK